jgi:hypothetical protein
MKLSAIKVDSKLAEQGDWVDGIPDLPGIRIKARGTNNTDYRILEAKLVREIPRRSAPRASCRPTRTASPAACCSRPW